MTEDGNEPLSTERLLLDPITRAHAAALLPVLSDTRMYTYLDIAPPQSVERLRRTYGQLESRRSPDGQERWLNWAIRVRGSLDYIGRVEATVRRDHTADIAYLVAPDRWRQGYGGEAVNRMLDYLGERLGVRRAKAQIEAANTASIRLVEKLGFRLARTEERDLVYVRELSSAVVDGAH